MQQTNELHVNRVLKLIRVINIIMQVYMYLNVQSSLFRHIGLLPLIPILSLTIHIAVVSIPGVHVVAEITLSSRSSRFTLVEQRNLTIDNDWLARPFIRLRDVLDRLETQ